MSRSSGRVIRKNVLTRRGAVQEGRLVDLAGDGGHAGGEQDDVEPDVRPDHHDHDADQRDAGVAEPGLLERAEAHARQERVEHPVLGIGVVDLLPQDRDDRDRQDLGEEEDDFVEAGAPHAGDPRGTFAAAADIQHEGEEETEGQRDDRHEEEQKDVVPQRLPEQVVVDQFLIVVQPDEVLLGGQSAPARHRNLEVLEERRDHEDPVERQGNCQESDDEPVLAVSHVAGRSRLSQ